MDEEEIVENLSDSIERIISNIRTKKLTKRLLRKRKIQRDPSPSAKSEKIMILSRNSFSAVKFVLPGTPIMKPKIVMHK